MKLIIGIVMIFTLNSSVLFDFTKKIEFDNWQIVNDGVMGGLSEATFKFTPEGTAVFSGEVSLENNGGFSSVRYYMGNTDVRNYNTVVLYLKGDGKKYQLRIRENDNDWFNYIYTFQTSGEWETIEIPLKKMYPSFRGRTLNRPNFSGDSIVGLTILIGNKKAETFELELQKAWLSNK